MRYGAPNGGKGVCRLGSRREAQAAAVPGAAHDASTAVSDVAHASAALQADEMLAMTRYGISNTMWVALA